MQEWHNWVGNQSARAELRAPRNEEELRAAVLAAVEKGRRVRPAGASYSWAPLVPVRDGLIVDMRHMKRLHSIDIDAKTIEVDAGMDIRELNAIAARYGLTLVTPPLFPGPTVGGAVATGTHGTSFRSGNFSDDVLAMTIVDHQGEPRRVVRPSGDPRRPEARDYEAAQVALGTLGVIQSVKLELVEQYNVYTERRLIDVDEVLEGFEDLAQVRSCDFLEIFYVPLQEKMWVYLMTRTDSHPDPETLWSGIFSEGKKWVQNAIVERFYPWASRNVPGAYPYIYDFVNRTYNSTGVGVATASDTFHFQKAYPKNWDMSYAFPHHDAARAWRAGISLLREYAAAGVYPINLMMHCRFTAGSTAWLAPDSDQDTCYVEVTTADGTPGWQDFYRELERRWVDIESSRPHWAKLYFETDGIKRRYPRMDDFLRVRERWDPQRVFLNEFLEKQVFQLGRIGAAVEKPRARPKLAPACQRVPAPT
jgi:L-gulonolactone oxidase